VTRIKGAQENEQNEQENEREKAPLLAPRGFLV